MIATVVRNIVAGHRPVYALGEWAAPYDPTLLGLAPGEVELLNDDRVGRTLDRLFDADRASLITATVLGVIRALDIDTSGQHNDSTTVTVTGNYPDADGRDRGGKATASIRHGHNKDHRPTSSSCCSSSRSPPTVRSPSPIESRTATPPTSTAALVCGAAICTEPPPLAPRGSCVDPHPVVDMPDGLHFEQHPIHGCGYCR